MKRLLSFILTMTLSLLSLNAATGTFGNNLTWEINESWGELYINGSGSMPDYTSATQAPWYQYRSSIRKVYVSSTIDHIGNYAFAGYTNIVRVWSQLNTAGWYHRAEWRLEYTYNPLSIGAHAFDGCTQLSEIYSYAMGHSWYWLDDEWVDWDDDDDPCPMEIRATRITEIGDYAFYGCSSLSEIKVNPGTTIGVNSFAYCSTLARVDGAINAVGNAAFYNCSQLTSIVLQYGISRIGNNTFYDCSRLGSISIPSSVTEIGQSAFYGCTNAVINIPNTVTRVEWDAFYNCQKLASVSTNLTYIGGGAFEGCTTLNAVNISSNIEYIGSRAFYGCSNLSSVTFPQSTSNLTYFGNYAFYSTPYLSSIVAENGVKYIGPAAIEYDGTVPNLILKEGTMFMDYIFSINTRTNVRSITIPGTLREIPQQGFFYCTNLSEVTFEYSATPIIVNNNKYSDGIGGGIFENSPVTKITINRDITLTYKYQLHSYDKPECGLFYTTAVPKIREIIIGENVTTIPDYLLNAEYNSRTNLQSITCQGDVPPACSTYALWGVPNTTTLYVPCGALDAYQNATGWSKFTNIELDICKYNRPTTAGNFGTICLSMGVDANDLNDCGATFYSVGVAITDENDELTMLLIKKVTGGLAAGVPYLFKATGSRLALPYIDEEPVTEAVVTAGMVGNLAQSNLMVPNDGNCYILGNDNLIYKVIGNSNYVGTNRAYIDLSGIDRYILFGSGSGSLSAPARILTVEEGNNNNPIVTALEQLSQRPNNLKKMLVNNQIIIVRDGTKYNLVGQTL